MRKFLKNEAGHFDVGSLFLGMMLVAVMLILSGVWNPFSLGLGESKEYDPDEMIFTIRSWAEHLETLHRTNTELTQRINKLESTNYYQKYTELLQEYEKSKGDRPLYILSAVCIVALGLIVGLVVFQNNAKKLKDNISELASEMSEDDIQEKEDEIEELNEEIQRLQDKLAIKDKEH